MVTFAPDLLNGRIVNGVRAANSWVTGIQSVLVVSSCGQTETAYLSHECRKEDVPFIDPSPALNAGIVQQGSPFEWLTFTIGDKFYQIPSVDTIMGANAYSAVPHVKVGEGLLFGPITYPSWESNVHCPDRAVRFLDTDTVIDGLNSRALSANDLFLKFAWSDDGGAYVIYAPSRYLNFSNRGVASTRYVQPFTGHVLFKLGPLSVAGYLAVALRDDGKMLAELIAPIYLSAYDLIAGLSDDLGPQERAALELLSNSAPAYARCYNLVVNPSGTLEFFTYVTG